jgi:hypothetical protein
METIKLEGHFTIRVRDAKTGQELKKYESKNLICDGAKAALARLMGQVTTPADYQETKLWAIYAGSGTTSPSTSDTALETIKFQKACDQPMTVTTALGLVEATILMESGEGNGKTYTEIGFFSRGSANDPEVTTNALMYSRQLHGAIEKTSAITIEYTWRLQITT